MKIEYGKQIMVYSRTDTDGYGQTQEKNLGQISYPKESTEKEQLEKIGEIWRVILTYVLTPSTTLLRQHN